jgi:hypothetical protein
MGDCHSIHSLAFVLENRIQHRPLSRDKLIHVRLHALVERGSTPRMAEAPLYRFHVRLFLCCQERR